jgi:hypothetical protein
MEDKIQWYLRVIPVVRVMPKSGDALCCQFGGKNCKRRVPWHCLMPLNKLNDPMHDCEWIWAIDLEAIYKKAARVGMTQEEKRKIRQY